jgi:S1-C subfamily serine protease
MAVLTIEGTPLPAAQWHRDPLPLGAFLIAPQPSGQSAAFGVVSVLERNLRETDKAYLGVLGDNSFAGKGVKVSQVMEDSGAAAAGLRRGDIITRINDRDLSGLLELQNVLKDVPPTATIRLDITRNGKPMKLEATLGNRPKLPSFPNSRLRAMEQMGTDLSRVRSDFPNAIQSDMRPNPNQVGGPVVDLKGRIVGITLARADRTRSFIMPAEAVARMLRRPGGHRSRTRTPRHDPPRPAAATRHPTRRPRPRPPPHR